MLLLPMLDQAVDRVDEAVLGDRVEEANKVIVGCVEGDVSCHN